jgi:hypothetical protein
MRTLAWLLIVFHSMAQAAEPDLSALVGIPVSVKPVGDSLIVADYQQLYRFADNRLVRLRVNLPAGVAFRPTETAHDGAEVFVANYTGNDVLVGTLRGNTLTVTRRIGDGQTISPEGVTLFGDKVGIANYDSNRVQIFDRLAHHNDPPRCTVPLNQAHGIVYTDGHLFASSLQDRKVVKIDTAACRIVAEIGGMGWNAGRFLWPIRIAAAGPGRIIVADAHTGLLSVLRTTDLAIERQFGGNGPGFFNMPYGVEWRDGTVWVASAFSRSIIALRGLSWDGVQRYSATPRAWSWAKFGDNAKLDQKDYDVYRSRSSVTIRGHCYRPSYGALPGCTGHEPPLGFKFVQRSGYMYFTQALSCAPGVLVSSPQNPIALLYRNTGGEPDEIVIGLDAWVVNGALVGPHGPIKLPH